MKRFLKLLTISLTSGCIFSCSAGDGGAAITPVIPDASTQTTVKILQMTSQRSFCGSNFSSALSNNQMNVKVDFNNDKTFNVAFTFYDTPCSASGTDTVGNTIGSYAFNGNYAVTTLAGNVIMTVASSTMTIFAGDHPETSKKFVEWMNSCSDMEGSFSYSQNTTLSLSLGPQCSANVARAFPFTAHGSSIESTEDSINRFVRTE